MDPHTIYTHSIESLRFALNAIGYDNCIKELNFIKHIQHVTPSPLKQEQPIHIPVKEPEIAPEIEIVTEPDHKNIVIEPPSKYSRTTPPDSVRCTKILDGGIRCTFKKTQGADVCSRHNK